MKKAISLLLCVIIALSALSVGFAGAYSPSCPYIFIHGFMGKDLYSDKNDRDSEPVWPPSSDKILELVKAHIGDLLKFLVTKNYDELGDAILGPVGELLSSADLDPNGEVADNSGAYMVYPPESSVTSSSELDFNYDWRIDPIEVASQLNDFINFVTRASGCDKVVIECHSFGGIVVNTYTQLYGYDKIKSVCYNTTAIFGEQYTGEMMSGNIVFEGEAISAFIKRMIGENEYKKLLVGLIDLLDSAGVTGDIAKLGNGIVENLGERAIKQILLPMFGRWLSIWAMIPDAYIDSSMDFVFNKVYKDDGVDHSKLKAKIDDYNTRIRPNKKSSLLEQDETVNTYVISRYNYPSVPLTPTWKKMSDGVVDTASSSFGAVCAEYGDKFSDEYVASRKDRSCVNPDLTVCSETCLFPDRTWFIKDLQHAAMPDDMEDMVRELLFYDGEATVETFDMYPRFLDFDEKSEKISPDNGTEAEQRSVFRFFYDIYLALLRLRRKIFDLIFFFRK